MFERGYLRLGRWRGADLRVHWSTALGALVFGGLSFAPVFWVGFLVLVIVHELGHAILAWRCGQQVLSIDVTGFGGLCRWSGYASAYERAKIAWGGVLAQAVLLIVALGVLVVLGPATGLLGAQLSRVFVRTNLILIGLNLLPFSPLDGAQAWAYFPQLAGRWRGRRVLSGIRLPWRGGQPEERQRRGSGAKQAQQNTGERDSRDAARATELAELLRRIGDEAGRARRKGSSDQKR